ncbi:hypothetical protein Droror1_Dr00026640, partial [Drosera rotundifolia]
MELAVIKVEQLSITLETWATTTQSPEKVEILKALQTVQAIEEKVLKHKAKADEMLEKSEKEAMIQQFIKEHNLSIKRNCKAIRPNLIPSRPTTRYGINPDGSRIESGIID